MGEWVDGWMDGQMNGGMGRQDRWADRRIGGWWMDRQLNVQMNKWHQDGITCSHLA